MTMRNTLDKESVPSAIRTADRANFVAFAIAPPFATRYGSKPKTFMHNQPRPKPS